MTPDDPSDDGAPPPPESPAPAADDLDGYLTPTRRFVRGALPVVGVLVVAAMVLALGRGLIDAWLFDRAGDRVEDQLEDVLEDDADEALARSVLLVRTLRCDGTRASGTAFTVRAGDETVLVTNRHVVEGASAVGLSSLTGELAPTVVAWRLAASADVAALLVDDPDRLPAPLRLTRSPVRPGADVRTVGFPRALPFTSAGTVQEVTGGRLTTTVRTDPGASGSPLVDASDVRVVGQIFARTDDGLGVATTAAALREAVGDLGPAIDSC